jgi:uncharacterized protein
MHFINNQVNTDQLPAAETVILNPVHKDYRKILNIYRVLFSSLLLIAAVCFIVFMDEWQTPVWITVTAAAFVIFTFLYYWLQQKHFYSLAFAIREKDIIYRSGWLIQHTRVCPFNRIQHSSVSTGMLERKYGLATLHLYTAASQGADLHISGLTETEAARLKDWINKKITVEEPNNA